MKKNNLKTSITIFSMLLCFSLFAQGPPGGGGGGRGGGQGRGGQKGGKPEASEILSKLDTNKDNFIDKDEAAKDKRGKISEDFEVIDSNDDGLIDLEELDASLNDRIPKKVSPKKIIKEVDDNGDGTLNELEVAAKGKRDLSEKFSEIDTNKDAELDEEELKAFFGDSEDEDDKKSKRKRRD